MLIFTSSMKAFYRRLSAVSSFTPVSLRVGGARFRSRVLGQGYDVVGTGSPQVPDHGALAVHERPWSLCGPRG